MKVIIKILGLFYQLAFIFNLSRSVEVLMQWRKVGKEQIFPQLSNTPSFQHSTTAKIVVFYFRAGLSLSGQIL